MAYASLQDCLTDLERHGHLVRVKEEVDPNLEMAAIHLRVHERKGPGLLFENLKGSKFRAASNIFGTIERSKFIFRNSIDTIQKLIRFRNNPVEALRHPLKNFSIAFAALKALPLKNPVSKPVIANEISISELPLIKHWPNDGGAFVTLPQVYTENAMKPGILNANLGMYRIQLTGNNYKLNEEVGLHYQIHRGIGVHQAIANNLGIPLKVSVFVGGPPSHTLAAVMPLPEGISELTFAGVLGERRFRYFYKNGFCISADADFVITGEVRPGENKPEGPFGDHLGYYSLQHPFPLMHVHNVFAKKDAIWPFTVVGRPPQEDTSFGELIHELTGDAVANEIPGLKEVHAVDAAGVHPLLLAIGSERYTPYMSVKQPSEILTIANHILGTGQLSLAKFLFITADETNQLSTREVRYFLEYVLKRINPETDIHFQTNTSIDTLDYSGTSLNKGSKVVFAAYSDERRLLNDKIPACIMRLRHLKSAALAMPGIACITLNKFESHSYVKVEIGDLNDQLKSHVVELSGTPLIVLCDDSNFCGEKLINFLWVAFTRCNPSHDIHGIDSFVENKHWGCKGPVIIDARIKQHHAPALEKDQKIENQIERIFRKGGSLNGY